MLTKTEIARFVAQKMNLHMTLSPTLKDAVNAQRLDELTAQIKQRLRGMRQGTALEVFVAQSRQD